MTGLSDVALCNEAGRCALPATRLWPVPAQAALGMRRLCWARPAVSVSTLRNECIQPRVGNVLSSLNEEPEVPGFQVSAVRFYGHILETRCPLASEVWEWEATSSHPPPGQAGGAVQASVPLSGQV